MNTQVLIADTKNIDHVAKEASRLLKSGELVAIPTETVYGLAAQIYSEDAIKRIFQVKGRPQDNPLIVHISTTDMLDELVEDVTPDAAKLIKAFWPGPLTIIFKKKSKVSDTITCGMQTVAVRFPVHPVAQKIINKTNIPLAAPSANLSGKPSPTTAEHCFKDLNGKVPLIVDGGPCDVGVESTVISIVSDIPTILRPGIISLEEIQAVVGNARISSDVFRKVGEKEAVASPGLKYRHYAPSCPVVMIESSSERYIEYVNKNGNSTECAMCFEEEDGMIMIPHEKYGALNDPEEQAHNIFNLLRVLDEKGYSKIYIHAPRNEGKALAVSNRLIRAAGFQVVSIND